MSAIDSLIASLESQPATVESISLGGGRIADMLGALAVVNKLGQLSKVGTPIDTAAGLEERAEILLEAAVEAARLTDSTVDDEFVAQLRKEIMVPEVLGFMAYGLRRVKQARS